MRLHYDAESSHYSLARESSGKSTVRWLIQLLGPERRITCSSTTSGEPASHSTISGANRVRRITRRTCVTSIPSDLAISATDAVRSSSSSCRDLNDSYYELDEADRNAFDSA